MDTLILKADDNAIKKAAAVIKAGGLCAFPTETVYGLGANALSAEAVNKIFIAKGRPSDNPLIVHVDGLRNAEKIAAFISDTVKTLINTLGPAPLTYVLRKKPCIPGAVTAGLDTVGIRIPAHETALKLIRECGLPLAAPSANSSGRPSPTTAAHVYDDLNGKIPLILDGGGCGVGLESTVVDFTAETPLILRPGGFSKERLEQLLKMPVGIYKKQGDAPLKSPGLKYKHYAPDCKIIAVPYDENTLNALKIAYDNQVQTGGKSVIICQNSFITGLGGREYIAIGNDSSDAAKSIFKIFRHCEGKYNSVICHMYADEGLGRAFNDRIARAASEK